MLLPFEQNSKSAGQVKRLPFERAGAPKTLPFERRMPELPALPPMSDGADWRKGVEELQREFPVKSLEQLAAEYREAGQSPEEQMEFYTSPQARAVGAPTESLVKTVKAFERTTKAKTGEERLRGATDIALGAAETVISAIPAVTLSRVTAETVLPSAEAIGEAIGGEKGKKVAGTLTHYASILPFGWRVLLASAASEGGSAGTQKLLESTEWGQAIPEEDRNRIVEAAGHASFFGGLGLAHKAGKLVDFRDVGKATGEGIRETGKDLARQQGDVPTAIENAMTVRARTEPLPRMSKEIPIIQAREPLPPLPEKPPIEIPSTVGGRGGVPTEQLQALAEKIRKGATLYSAEELQLQKNYPVQLEAELRTTKAAGERGSVGAEEIVGARATEKPQAAQLELEKVELPPSFRNKVIEELKAKGIEETRFGAVDKLSDADLVRVAEEAKVRTEAPKSEAPVSRGGDLNVRGEANAEQIRRFEEQGKIKTPEELATTTLKSAASEQPGAVESLLREQIRKSGVESQVKSLSQTAFQSKVAKSPALSREIERIGESLGYDRSFFKTGEEYAREIYRRVKNDDYHKVSPAEAEEFAARSEAHQKAVAEEQRLLKLHSPTPEVQARLDAYVGTPKSFIFRALIKEFGGEETGMSQTTESIYGKLSDGSTIRVANHPPFAPRSETDVSVHLSGRTGRLVVNGKSYDFNPKKELVPQVVEAVKTELVGEVKPKETKGTEGTPLFEKEKPDGGQLAFSLASIAASQGVDYLPGVDDDTKKALKGIFGVVGIVGIAKTLSPKGMEAFKEIESFARRSKKTLNEGIRNFLKSEEAKALEEADRRTLGKIAGVGIADKVSRQVAEVKPAEALPKVTAVKESLPEAEYNKFIQAEKAKGTVKGKLQSLKESAKGYFKSAVGTYEKFIKSTDRQIEHAAGRKYFRKLTEFDFKTQKLIRERENVYKDFVDALGKFSDEDIARLKYAMLNSDVAVQNSLFEKYGGQAAQKKVRDLLNEIGKDSNLEPTEGYYPRGVKNYAELIKEFQGMESVNVFQKLIEKKQERFKSELTDEQKFAVIDNALRGYNAGITLSKLGNEKARVIDIVNAHLSKHYYDPISYLGRYIAEMTEMQETRRFFGKLKDGSSKSIGEIIVETIQSEGLDYERANKLRWALHNRFQTRNVPKVVSAIKKAVYVEKLGQLPAALTQLKDLSLSLYRSGPRATAEAMYKVVTGKKAVGLEDIGLLERDIAREISDGSKLTKVLDENLKWAGFSKFDAFGKETFMNAYLARYQRLAKKNAPLLQERLGRLFDAAESKQVKEDLKAGTKSDNVKLLLFSELTRTQPISKSALPAGYHQSAYGRIFYTFRTFAVRRLNFIIDEVRTAPTKRAAMARAMKLAFYTSVLGASIDTITNILLGRELKPEDLDDTLVYNIMDQVGLNRYLADKYGREQFTEATARILSALPIPYVDNIYADIRRAVKGQEFKGNIIKSIPVVGRTIQSRLFPREEKKKKASF